MNTATVAVGDRLPPCYGVSADRTFYSFEEQYGRPAVRYVLLTFLHSDAAEVQRQTYLARTAGAADRP